MIAISSCLIGKKCRYNGADSFCQALVDELNENDCEYIDICPELLAGLPTPRTPCEIVGGEGKDVVAGTAKIVDVNGNDITSAMLNGAKKAFDVCIKKKVEKAYLKQNSPTCGCGKIYDGSFTSALKDGNGIFAELLLVNGIDVTPV